MNPPDLAATFSSPRLRTELAILLCPGANVEELLQCLTGRQAQGVAPLCELHDVETAFPAFDL